MEFMSRGGARPTPAPQHATNHTVHPAAGGGGRRKRVDWSARSLRYLLFILLVAAAMLMSAVSLYLAVSDTGTGTEARQINNTKYQAVFLNNGQVYFGKITKLNSQIVVINDVFYLYCNDTSSSGSQACQENNTYTLYKLGVSELHSPEDKMIINRDQVSYWENLKDSGKVVSAIKQYKQNPNASQVQPGDGSSQAQPSTSTPQNSANPTPPPTNKKP